MRPRIVRSQPCEDWAKPFSHRASTCNARGISPSRTNEKMKTPHEKRGSPVLLGAGRAGGFSGSGVRCFYDNYFTFRGNDSRCGMFGHAFTVPGGHDYRIGVFCL